MRTRTRQIREALVGLDSRGRIHPKHPKPEVSWEPLPVVDRLWKVSDEIAEELADVATEALPEQYRSMTNCHSVARELVPVTLWHISRGGLPDLGQLESIRLSAPINQKNGIPPSAVLAAIQASVSRFTSIVIRHSTPADASFFITIMGRAAALTHLYATVYISGTERAAEPRPEWWSGQSVVARRSLKLLSEGYSTKSIAKTLCYSEQTITYHLGNLMRRFGCLNRTEMVSRAHEAGVLSAVEEPLGGANLDEETGGHPHVAYTRHAR